VTYREQEVTALLRGIKSARHARRYADARWYISRLRLLRATKWTPLPDMNDDAHTS
jgi:hypothetical protein